MLLILLETI